MGLGSGDIVVGVVTGVPRSAILPVLVRDNPSTYIGIELASYRPNPRKIESWVVQGRHLGAPVFLRATFGEQ